MEGLIIAVGSGECYEMADGIAMQTIQEWLGRASYQVNRSLDMPDWPT